MGGSHKVNLFFCFRPYVTFCAKQRQGATNEADKRLWKLMANIIYGMYITYLGFISLGEKVKYILEKSNKLHYLIFCPGKFIEDVTKRVSVKYFNSFERMESCLRNHVHAMPTIINSELVQVIINNLCYLLTH